MSTPPEWLNEFTQLVANLVCPIGSMAPLGCHVHLAEAAWEVTFFASRTEVVGGPRDGERRPSRFILDLQGLMGLFSTVHSCHWQSHRCGHADEIGAHISIEGDYAGQPVWLRIPASAPERFESGRHVLIHERLTKDAW